MDRISSSVSDSYRWWVRTLFTLKRLFIEKVQVIRKLYEDSPAFYVKSVSTVYLGTQRLFKNFKQTKDAELEMV